MENLRISKTVMPEKPMEMNKWFKKYKVGSRCEKYGMNESGSYLNEQYDFTKLNQETPKFNFFGSLNIFKLLSI